MDPAIGKLEKCSLQKFKSQWTGVLVVMVPNEEFFKKGTENISIVSRLLYLLKPHRGVILQSIFGALIYTILGLGTSIFVQKIVDYALPNSNENLLNLMGVVMILLLSDKSFL